MDGFKVICNKCGKESKIQQCNDSVGVKGSIKIDYWDRYYDSNRISFTCECGNKILDK
jgi:hypothetical protein